MEQELRQTNLEVQLTGEDGNVFNLMGIVSKALKRNGYRNQAEEMTGRVWKSESYSEAISIFNEYVDVY
ncbi:TPA: hypothetical protein RPI10_002761 [Staphylococcus aureus]|nr:hypothetical protein [Staphylococcus aureus]HDY5190419.1 hypothetical protein [Staphylococcus aureus]HDY5793323.1 hypothetical protein [Staphylococcus aureus]